MPSAEHERVVTMINGGVAQDDWPLQDQRAMMEASAELFPPEPDVQADSILAGDVPADWVTVPASESGRVVLYLHGGGYSIGSLTSHRPFVAQLARRSGMRALSVDYRLAPEHPFPAAIEDCHAALRWLHDHADSLGIDPERIAVGAV